jgi:hypothetical protein
MSPLLTAARIAGWLCSESGSMFSGLMRRSPSFAVRLLGDELYVPENWDGVFLPRKAGWCGRPYARLDTAEFVVTPSVLSMRERVMK